MSDEKTQKAWAYLTASLRLCTDAYRILQAEGTQTEVKVLEASISDLLKARSMVGKRLHG